MGPARVSIHIQYATPVVCLRRSTAAMALAMLYVPMPFWSQGPGGCPCSTPEWQEMGSTCLVVAADRCSTPIAWSRPARDPPLEVVYVVVGTLIAGILLCCCLWGSRAGKAAARKGVLLLPSGALVSVPHGSDRR